MEAERKLKSSNGLQRGTPVGNLVLELLNASTRTHLIHLTVTGPGSFAAHKALNEFYDGIKSLGDDLAEQYQGVTETLINFQSSTVERITSVQEAINYLRELYMRTDSAQGSCPYSEIKNTLDEVKSLINTTKYKLLFLQ